MGGLKGDPGICIENESPQLPLMDSHGWEPLLGYEGAIVTCWEMALHRATWKPQAQGGMVSYILEV